MISLFFKLRNLINLNKFYIKPFRFILYIIYRFIMWFYGSSIPLNTKFEDIPKFPHGLYGIFISGDAIIHKNVTIYHQVTIGSITSDGSKYKGAPEIFENVTIGAGAKVIGGISVYKNSKIGANCVVVDNIEENRTVVMNKPRVVIK